MKRLFTLILSMIMIGCSVRAYSADYTTFGKDVYIETERTSEYDMVIKESLDSRKKGNPLSEDPLLEYKKRFDERCREPEEVLEKMGYSMRQIELMKDYLAGRYEFYEIAAATAATLTTTLTCSTHTTTKYVVKYTFSWSTIPTGLGQDGIALGAYGIDSTSHRFDTKTSSKSGSVKYCYNDGTTYKTEYPTLTADDPGFKAKFASYKLNSSGSDWVYAKSGSFKLTIVPTVSGSTTFAAARARGSYGHSSAPSTKISIAIGLSSNTITITFTKTSGSGSVSAMGTKQKVFYNNGSSTTE